MHWVLIFCFQLSSRPLSHWQSTSVGPFFDTPLYPPACACTCNLQPATCSRCCSLPQTDRLATANSLPISRIAQRWKKRHCRTSGVGFCFSGDKVPAASRLYCSGATTNPPTCRWRFLSGQSAGQLTTYLDSLVWWRLQKAPLASTP